MLYFHETISIKDATILFKIKPNQEIIQTLLIFKLTNLGDLNIPMKIDYYEAPCQVIVGKYSKIRSLNTKLKP